MRTVDARFWIHVVASMLACSYVILYDHHQVERCRQASRHLVGLAEWLQAIDGVAFLVPVVIVALSFLPQTRRYRIFPLFPDLLAIFSIGWICFALLVWEVQQPPVVAYPGFE